MAPKKPTKPKKEEVVEIPNTESLPNGICTQFIGGWSGHSSFAALNEITKSRESGDRVLVLPGTLDEGSITVHIRSLTVEGAVAVATPEAAPVADDAEAAAEDVPVVPVGEPKVVDAVVVRGKITFEAWIPPVEIKAPSPVPVEEVKKDTKPKPKEKKKVVVEEEAPPPPPPAEEVVPTGANPAAWPTVKLRRLCFKGTVIASGVHLDLEDCHFIGGDSHQLQAHQYCTIKLTRCTFSLSQRSCIYAYPTSRIVATDCTFTGINLQAEQQGGAGGNAAPGSVGLQLDDADATITGSRFRNLAFGALFHDRCKGASISKCDFDLISNSAVQFDGSHALLQGNQIRRCEYYGILAKNKTSAKIIQNDIQSIVRIDAGSSPLLHSNRCAYPVQDRNESGNVYMQPTY